MNRNSNSLTAIQSFASARSRPGSGAIIQPSDRLIRFEEKRECFRWVHPSEMIFVKSADHYIYCLIRFANATRWMSRHSTLKELMTNLPEQDFIRLNKFYLFNRKYYAGIDEKEKKLFIDNKTFIPIPHRISPYIIALLKAGNT